MNCSDGFSCQNKVHTNYRESYRHRFPNITLWSIFRGGRREEQFAKFQLKRILHGLAGSEGPKLQVDNLKSGAVRVDLGQGWVIICQAGAARSAEKVAIQA